MSAADDPVTLAIGALLDATSAVCVCDADGRIVDRNAAFRGVAGLGPGRLDESIDPEERVAAWATIRETVASGDMWRGDLALRRADGSTVWLDARATAVRDTVGALSHVVIAGTDISRCKLAETARAQSESRLAAFVA